jgi:hypothetical protein
MPVTTRSAAGGLNVFVAGDARVNEHAVLTSVHTAFLREHNRLCDTMANLTITEDEKFERAKAVWFLLNPSWWQVQYSSF